MNLQKSNIILTIGVPTRNRSTKLSNLLSFLVNEIDSFATNKIEILISDNASEDDTSNTIKGYSEYKFIRHLKNEENIGFDGNVAKVLSSSRGKYVWLLSDDDIIQKGALKKILLILEKYPESSYCFLNYNFKGKGFTIPASPNLSEETIICDHNDFFLNAKDLPTLMSSNIFRRSLWKNDRANDFIGSGFVHILMIPSVIINHTAIIIGEKFLQQDVNEARLINNDADFIGPQTSFDNPLTSFKHAAYKSNKYPEKFYAFDINERLKNILKYELLKYGYNRDIIKNTERSCAISTLRQAIYLKRYAQKRYNISELSNLIFQSIALNKNQLIFWYFAIPVLICPRKLFRKIADLLVKIMGSRVRLDNIF